MTLGANDPRIVELAKHAKRLFPNKVFFIAVAGRDPNDTEPIASLGNVTAEVQVHLLRALLQSFDQGTASPMQPVRTSDVKETERRWACSCGREGIVSAQRHCECGTPLIVDVQGRPL